MSSQSQERGSDLEHAFQRVLACFFREAEYEVDHNRLQAAGTQLGFDLQWTVRPPGQAEAVRLLFECKNYASRVPLKEIVDKPIQAEFGGDRVDFWILVSPHTSLANDAEASWDALAQKFGFPLLRPTPDEGVNSLIALDPDAYRIVYGRDPEPFDRASVLERWRQWFANHLSSARYLQRFSKLLEVVDAVGLGQKFTTKDERLRDLALAFYRGTRPGWEEIVNNVDVRRGRPAERVARAFDGNIRGVHLVLVHCEGGSGKSTFLRRVALEAAERGGLVMFSAGLPHTVDAGQLQEEIIQMVRRRQGRRVMVVIDNGAAVLEQLTLLGQRLRDETADVVLVVAERLARWREAEDELKAQGVSRIPSTVEERLVLPALEEDELRDLVGRLKHFRVSDRVQVLSEENLEEDFRERFRGSLLVTLHEVIAGQKFDDIVRGEQEEFQKQHPSFPFMYAFTAALHQFGLSVPETLLARMASVPNGDLTNELKFQDVLARSEEARLLAKTSSGWATRHEIVAKSIFRGLERGFGKRILLAAVTKLDPKTSDEVTAVMTLLVSPQTRRDLRGLGYARELYEAARRVISNVDLDFAFLRYCLSRGDLDTARVVFSALPAGSSKARFAQEMAIAERKRGRFAEARNLLREALGWAGDAPDATSDAERLRSSAGSVDVISLTEYLLFEHHRHPESPYAAHLADVAWDAGVGDAHFVELRANIAQGQKRPDDAARYRQEGEDRFPSSIPVFRLQRAMFESSEASRASIFRETIEQGRGDAAIFQEYALLEKRRGQPGKARALFEQGILADPADASLYQAYALLEKDQGEYEKARALFKRGIEADPTHAYLYQAYALLEKDQGEYEEARALFKRGIEADPTHGPLYHAYALLEKEQGEYDEARALFERGIEADPTHASLYQAYALLEKEQGECDKAGALFERGIEADPTNAYLFLGWAEMEGGLRHWRRAEKILAQGERCGAGPSAPVFQYRGRILGQLQRFDDARRSFEQGLQVDPEHAPIFQELAKLFARLGDLEKAEAVLRDGCAQCPDDLLLPGTMAKLLITVGRAEEAEGWAKQSLSKCRDAGEREQTRRFIFDKPLRLGTSARYRFVKRDVEGVVSRMVTDTEKAYGFVEEEMEGTSYYFSLRPNQKVDFFKGSRVWFDVIEFFDRKEHRFIAKFVEIIPEPINPAELPHQHQSMKPIQDKDQLRVG